MGKWKRSQVRVVPTCEGWSGGENLRLSRQGRFLCPLTFLLLEPELSVLRREVRR